MALFAIKDAIDLKIKKKGDNYISFSSGRTGTLTMNCQVMDDNFLCMMLGATKDSGGKISVTGAIPQQAYTAEGTFRTTTTAGDQMKKIKFYNLKAQVSADLTLSATDVSEFSLVLDILADDTGKIMDIENVSGGGSLSVNEPEIVSIKAKLED